MSISHHVTHFLGSSDGGRAPSRVGYQREEKEVRCVHKHTISTFFFSKPRFSEYLPCANTSIISRVTDKPDKTLKFKAVSFVFCYTLSIILDIPFVGSGSRKRSDCFSLHKEGKKHILCLVLFQQAIWNISSWDNFCNNMTSL